MRKQHRLIAHVLLADFFLFSNFASAAPNITSATPVATFSHNAVVNISGSGFGAKSQPAPQFWDPVDGQLAYAGLHDGDDIPVGVGKPWLWGSIGPDSVPKYKTTNSRGKFAAKYTNTGLGDLPAVVGGKDFTSVCANGKLYVSWWWYSTGDPIDCDSHSCKFFRISTTGNDSNTPDQYLWAGNHVQVYGSTAGGVIDDWMDSSYINHTNWNRMETVVDNSGNPKPNIKGWIGNHLMFDYTASSNITNLCGISALGYDVSNQPNPPIMDFGEIYVDNTLARVEICNAATKASSTHCEIQIPQTTWNDGSLQIKVNQGSFADGASAYLYVVDSAGDANASGFPITFGSGSSDTTAPANPTGLSVS